MSEEWLSLAEAVETVRSRFNTSVGRAQGVVKQARASGEVRENGARHQLPAGGFLLGDDDGIADFDQRPGDLKAIAQTDLDVLMAGPRLSKSDFLYWLDRQVPQDKPVATAPKQRRRLKSGAVEQAILAVWGGHGPPVNEPPDEIRARIAAWLKENRLQQGVTNERVMQIVREKQKQKQ